MTVKKIRKAILPVAGLGTRFLPATKAQPKEMLPIVDKPVIQYIVEEAVAAGITEIIIITGEKKRAIEDHFDHSFELDYTLTKRKKFDLLESIHEVESLANFVYVRQAKPLGDGHAILSARHVVGNEPFLVLFGDEIYDSKTPAAAQLIDVYEKTGTCVMGLTKVPKEETNRYGIINPEESNDKLHKIKSMIEKPDPKDAPSNLAFVGKYVVTPEIWDKLEDASNEVTGEIRLIDGLIRLREEQEMYGLELEGKRYDTGNKFGLIKANIDFALKNKDIAPELKNYLKQIKL